MPDNPRLPPRRPSRPPAQVIGWTQDVFGQRWAVRERVVTRHGFAIARGWPEDRVPGPGKPGVGSPRVILTRALAAYLRGTPRWIDVDLPLGNNALGRFRRLLDLNYVEQRARWWAAHRQELRRLGPKRFADKHGLKEITARKYLSVSEAANECE